MSPSLPKKVFLKLLSIPITLKPLFRKKSADSDPIKPVEPVIRAIDIRVFLVVFFDTFLKLKKFH